MNNENKVGEIFKGLGILTLAFASIFARLFILVKIYDLTARPLLNGPSLTMYQIFVLSWFAGALTYRYTKQEEDKTDREKLKEIFVPVIALAISWFFAFLFFGRGL